MISAHFRLTVTSDASMRSSMRSFSARPAATFRTDRRWNKGRANVVLNARLHHALSVAVSTFLRGDLDACGSARGPGTGTATSALPSARRAARVFSWCWVLAMDAYRIMGSQPAVCATTPRVHQQSFGERKIYIYNRAASIF